MAMTVHERYLIRIAKQQKIFNFLSNPNIWYWLRRDYRIVAESIVEGLKDEDFKLICYSDDCNSITLEADGYSWEISIGLHSLAGTEKCVCLNGGNTKNFHKLDIRRFKSLYTLSRKIAKILKAGKK